MRILAIDDGGDFCLDWLMRCQAWGHDVRWFKRHIGKGVHSLAGEGLVPILRDLDEVKRKWLGWADLIFLPDNALYMSMLEPYRELGYPIFGCNEAGAAWEVDREVGQQVMKKAGLKIIPGRTFHDYDSAIAFVKKEGKPFVSKPSGEDNKALSYVANDAADLVYMLERWKKNPTYVAGAKKNGFIIQEKKFGTEMAVGGWFGPSGWSKFFCQNFEHKKLMNGDLGVNTGEMGTVVRYVRKCKLAEQVLLPVTKQLEAIGYVGFIDNNCIIDEAGIPWPMEFTMRPGWPLFYNQMALHLGDPAQWMVDCLHGKDTLKVKENEVCVSVVMALPDFPYSHVTNKDLCGIPIYNATDTDHIHLQQVMLGNAPVQVGEKVVTLPSLVTAGDNVLTCTGTGETITGARRSVYSTIKKIKIPNSPFYRTDIGVGRMKKQLPALQAMGYAKDLSY